jgi:hypothetical protein
MNKLNIEWLTELCIEYLYIKIEDTRNDCITALNADLYYLKGKINGYMTAFNLNYEETDKLFIIVTNKGKIISVIDKIKLLSEE